MASLILELESSMIYSRLFFRQVLVYPKVTSNTADNEEELLMPLLSYLEGGDDMATLGSLENMHTWQLLP